MDCSFLSQSYFYIILKCLLRDQFKLNMCVDQVGAKKAEKDSKVPEITSNQPSNIVKGAKYLAFLSSRPLKTREKYISFPHIRPVGIIFS